MWDLQASLRVCPKDLTSSLKKQCVSSISAAWNKFLCFFGRGLWGNRLLDLSENADCHTVFTQKRWHSSVNGAQHLGAASCLLVSENPKGGPKLLLFDVRKQLLSGYSSRCWAEVFQGQLRNQCKFWNKVQCSTSHSREVLTAVSKNYPEKPRLTASPTGKVDGNGL